MEFAVLLLLGIPAIFIIRWLLIRSRFASIEERLRQLEAEVAELRAERAFVAPALAKPAVAPVVPVAPVVQMAAPPAVEVTPEPVVAPVAFCEWCGKKLASRDAVCECRVTPVEAPIVVAPPPTLPPPPPPRPFVPEPIPEPVPAGPTFSERMREKMSGEEWEALVGGSLLNKLGALILVVGIALFLAYSFTQMGPAGRAAVGLGISLSMLAGGFFVERKDRYRIFARGLLGGGWAALYFTTYAMYAVEATRVIASPAVGTVLLFVVAVGMVGHSLKYRSQSLTGLAYFIAFVTLAIVPVTTLSVIALIPLAVSLLVIAYRFDWTAMALFGLVATWGTLVSRGDTGAPAWQAQTVFTIYWLIFEAFDLMRAARGIRVGWESVILPVNAFAFAGLSYMKWSNAGKDQLHLVAAAIGVAYLASTLLRARVRPPSSFVKDETTLERIFAGGYEGPVTVSVILSAAAVLWRFTGQWATIGLLAEAECLFLAGLYFGERYLRQLAVAVFGVQFAKMLLRDTDPRGLWVWPTAVSTVLYYVNRYLQRSAVLYGYAGSAMALLLLWLKVPGEHLGVAWFALATALFVFGWMRRLEDFRFQAYGVAVFGLGADAIVQAKTSVGVSAGLLYAGIAVALRSAADRMGEMERLWFRTVGSWSVTVLLAGLAWKMVPTQYLGLAWMVMALPLLELGLREWPKNFRVQSYVLLLTGALTVVGVNLLPIRNDGPLELRLIPAWASLAAWAFTTRLYFAKEAEKWLNVFSIAGTVFVCAGLWELLPPAATGPAWAAVGLILVEAGIALHLSGVEKQGHAVAVAAFGRMWTSNFTTTGYAGVVSHRVTSVLPVAAAFYHLWSRLGDRKVARYYLHAATILLFALMRFEFGRTFTVVGWAALGMVVLALGERWKVADLRWQGYVVAGAAFVRALATNFNAPENYYGVAGRVGPAAIAIGCLYASQLLSKTEKHARVYFSMLATALVTILLYHEVSGGMLTVAWGIEGILLLIAGFPLRDRVLRLSGLGLFLVCILKLFLFDLRNLETPYRIGSFIVLGLMLLSVSWIYTRFRDRIQRYL